MPSRRQKQYNDNTKVCYGYFANRFFILPSLPGGARWCEQVRDGDPTQYLHFYINPKGKCYWRVGEDVDAPNKDSSVKAVLSPRDSGLDLGTRDPEPPVITVQWRIL